MYIGKGWLLAAALLMMVGGTALVLEIGPAQQSVAQERPGDHWRNFDGHWSYWHEGDKRWYYTDGHHWYYHNGTGWVLYEFDKLFGRMGFHLGGYKVPGRDFKGPLPRHEIYRRP